MKRKKCKICNAYSVKRNVCIICKKKYPSKPSQKGDNPFNRHDKYLRDQLR